MVRGSFKPPKLKPKLPPELRGGRIGAGWYEDHIAIRDSRITNKEIDDGREKEMDPRCDKTSRGNYTVI